MILPLSTRADTILHVKPKIGCAGPTMCRDQLLMARGWTVLVVPYFQWLQLQGIPAACETYLRQVLLGYVDVGPCNKQFELKTIGRIVDTSTDEDESSVIPFNGTGNM